MTESQAAMNKWIPWMRRALQLAALAEGRTSPNPLVGAVILDPNGKLVGEGYHSCAGQNHAEIEALSQAGNKAKGGTLVVTLEPCCHHGKTPPCTQSILKAGIKRVIIGLLDPDPRVSGKGIEKLKTAGLEVMTGVLESESALLNREFIFRVKTGRPWGVLKWAMSVDGRIALPNGESKWISGEASRDSVHLLRSKCDAIVIGGGTLRKDDPLLTSRGRANLEPLRVVLTNTLDLPTNAKLWDVTKAKTLIAYGPDLDETILDEIPLGPQRLKLSSRSPLELFSSLGEMGCNKVLWECGPTLASAAIKDNCVQELVLFVAPKLIGGKPAMTPVGDLGLETIQESYDLQSSFFERKGSDLLWRLLL